MSRNGRYEPTQERGGEGEEEGEGEALEAGLDDATETLILVA